MHTSLSFVTDDIPSPTIPSFNSISTISQGSLHQSLERPLYKSITERPLAVSTLVLEDNDSTNPAIAQPYQGRNAESIYLSTQLLQGQNNQETLIREPKKSAFAAYRRNSARQAKLDSGQNSPRVQSRNDEVEIWKRKCEELEKTVAYYAALYQSAACDINKLCDQLLTAKQELLEYEALKIRVKKLEMELRPASNVRSRIQSILGDLYEKTDSVSISQKIEKFDDLKHSLVVDEEGKELIKSEILSMKDSVKSIVGNEMKNLEGHICTSGYVMDNISSFVANNEGQAVEKNYVNNTNNVLEGQTYMSYVINNESKDVEEPFSLRNDMKKPILLSSSYTKQL